MKRPDIEAYVRQDWPPINMDGATVVSEEWLAWAQQTLQEQHEYIRALEAARDAVLMQHMAPGGFPRSDPTCRGCLRNLFDAAVEAWTP